MQVLVCVSVSVCVCVCVWVCVKLIVTRGFLLKTKIKFSVPVLTLSQVSQSIHQTAHIFSPAARGQQK